MSRSTISTFKLFELFPDEPSARKYLEGRLWPNGVTSESVAITLTREERFLEFMLVLTFSLLGFVIVTSLVMLAL